jgi:AraC-like DNA-binding protein
VDIALTAGYYDQAHFIHDFQDLTGIRPTLYQAQSKEHRGNLAVEDEA